MEEAIMTDYQMRTIIKMFIKLAELSASKEDAIKQMKELLEQLPETKDKK